MFGKLGWDAIPLHDPIPLITSLMILIIGAGMLRWDVCARLLAVSVA